MRTALAIVALSLIPAFGSAGDGTAAPAGTQAKQDKSKQDKESPKPPPGKVYTDEDLKKARENPDSHVTVLGSSEPSPEAEGEAAQASDTPAPASDTPAPARDTPAPAGDTPAAAVTDEAGWKGLASQRWTAIRSAEQRIKDLEARLQELMLDTNPNPADLLDPSRLQKREAAKAETREQIEATRTQLADAQRALEQLQEKARSAGVPASWLEEPEPQR